MLQLIVDRRRSGIVAVQLVGVVQSHRVFTPDKDPHVFASYTLGDWTAARFVPRDRVGYSIESEMLREIRVATGVVVPDAVALVPPDLIAKHLFDMAGQAVFKM